MFELKKEYVINSDIENVWNFLTELREVTSCIPNLENLQIETPTKFRGKIKPPFSFVKGKFSVESELIELKEKERLTIAVRGSSIGASFKIMMTMLISYVSGTKIHLDVRVETTGLLKTLPKSLIHKVVEDIETPMLRCIKEKLE
ncbi:MAG: SRPBCC domain-containing protein [Nitrososphaerales archaeon]